jgi:hyperosmotically inducible protein
MQSPLPLIECKTKSGGVRLRRLAVTAQAIIGLILLSLAVEGCSGVGAGYRAAYKAAKSELTPTTLARDQRLKLQLREAILLDQTYEGLAISPYVFMERGFVVGLVNDQQEADAIMRAARTVEGLRSVYGHLPVKIDGSEEKDAVTDSISDITILSEVKTNLALVPDIIASQIEVKILSGEVVLLGVVASDTVKAAAEREARLVNGVTGVTNLLLLPESGYMKRGPRILR